jgi:hypothetical protein
MPERSIIHGTITAIEGVDRAGLKVQALERDLPSLERRPGWAPSNLGEATTDAEGRFEIAYSLEAFSPGDALSAGASPNPKADISFRVYDQSGQAVKIKNIAALNREFGPDDIFFNAPPTLEIAIALELIAQVGDSEYEQLVKAVRAVIAELSVNELKDDDLIFLVNELGLEPLRDWRQRIEWLRGSALLAAETGLPTEAYYGWARTSLPDLWAEVHDLDDEDRRIALIGKLHEQLAAAKEEVLTNHLLRAAEDRIIPAGFRERAAAIARALTPHTVRLRLERESTGEALGGYTVETFDLDDNSRPLGSDVTERNGEFSVSYLAAAPVGSRDLRFRVSGPGIGDTLEVSQAAPGTDGFVSVRIALPDARPALRQLVREGHINVPDAILQALDEQHGIKSLADIRRRGGLGRVADLRGVDADTAGLLDAWADLDRLSASLGETSALLKQHFRSVAAIAETPRTEFVRWLSKEGEGLNTARATELHVAAKAQTAFLDQIFAGIAADFAAGAQPLPDIAQGLGALSLFPPTR